MKHPDVPPALPFAPRTGRARTGPGPREGRAARAAEGAGAFARYWWAAAVVYALVAVLGAAPDIVRAAGVTPLRAEATPLVLLVALAHALVWEFMTHDAHADPT